MIKSCHDRRITRLFMVPQNLNSEFPRNDLHLHPLTMCQTIGRWLCILPCVCVWFLFVVCFGCVQSIHSHSVCLLYFGAISFVCVCFSLHFICPPFSFIACYCSYIFASIVYCIESRDNHLNKHHRNEDHTITLIYATLETERIHCRAFECQELGARPHGCVAAVRLCRQVPCCKVFIVLCFYLYCRRYQYHFVRESNAIAYVSLHPMRFSVLNKRIETNHLCLF